MPLPTDIAEDYLALRWDVEKVWGLDLPVEELGIDALLWHLDAPFWSTRPPASLFDLCPRDVLDDPDSYPQHYARILKADLTYPVETTRIAGRLVIMDGIHRLARAAALKRQTIRYRRVPAACLPQVAPT